MRPHTTYHESCGCAKDTTDHLLSALAWALRMLPATPPADAASGWTPAAIELYELDRAAAMDVLKRALGGKPAPKPPADLAGTTETMSRDSGGANE